MRGGSWEPAPGKPLKSVQQQEIEQLCRELAKVRYMTYGFAHSAVLSLGQVFFDIVVPTKKTHAKFGSLIGKINKGAQAGGFLGSLN